MSWSNYQEAKIVDAILGAAAYTAPGTVYVGLSRADPGETGSGLDEPSGNNYGRVAVTNNSTNWPAGNPKSNGTAINFPTPSGSWGLVTHFTLHDASTSGNLIGSFALTASKTIDSGDPVSFAVGALVITED